MRFTAPPHATRIDLAAGSFAVVDGAVDVPDDLGPGDCAGLAVNGFLRANDAPTATKPQPAKIVPPAAPQPDPAPGDADDADVADAGVKAKD